MGCPENENDRTRGISPVSHSHWEIERENENHTSVQLECPWKINNPQIIRNFSIAQSSSESQSSISQLEFNIYGPVSISRETISNLSFSDWANSYFSMCGMYLGWKSFERIMWALNIYILACRFIFDREWYMCEYSIRRHFCIPFQFTSLVNCNISMQTLPIKNIVGSEMLCSVKIVSYAFHIPPVKLSRP